MKTMKTYIQVFQISHNIIQQQRLLKTSVRNEFTCMLYTHQHKYSPSSSYLPHNALNLQVSGTRIWPI